MSHPRSLHEYYAGNSILPTDAAFAGSEQLKAYERHRDHFFREKLKLPRQLFNGASVVEFGPDAGDNAVVLAGWGARMTLVEPNPNAWPTIEKNFRRFGLGDRLDALVKSDLESFSSERRFDFILAEGFISHIRPEETWISKFGEILADDGFAIVSINDFFGMATEFLHKAIWEAVHRLLPDRAHDLVRQIFRSKWDSISHTRSFDSWEMDNLRNPLMRKGQFFDTADLLQRLARSGFNVYSSWPVYSDSLDMHWHKRRPDPVGDHRRAVEMVRRSRLSHMLGTKMFIGGELSLVDQAGEVLEGLISALDQAIEDCTPELAEDVGRRCAKLGDLIEKPVVFADSCEAKARARRRLDIFPAVLSCVAAGKLEGLVEYCNRDADFIGFWGQPHHYAVFSRQPGTFG